MQFVRKFDLLVPVILRTAILGLSACSGNSSYPGQYERGGSSDGHGGHSH